MSLWKWCERLYTQKRRKTVSESYHNFLRASLLHKMPLPLKWWNVTLDYQVRDSLPCDNCEL